MRSFFFSFFNKHWSRDNPSEWLECFLWLVQIWGWSKIQPQKDDWITCRTVSEDKTVRRQRLQWRDQTSLCHSLTYVKNLHFIPKQQQCYKTTIIFVQFCKRPELRILLLWKKKKSVPLNPVHFVLWPILSYVSETQTIIRLVRNYIEIMYFCRRMVRNSGADKKCNDKILTEINSHRELITHIRKRQNKFFTQKGKRGNTFFFIIILKLKSFYKIFPL